MDEFWLGIQRPCNSDPYSRSSFLWMDNTSLDTWSDWNDKQPDNYDCTINIQQSCAKMFGTGSNFTWDDEACISLVGTVCQYRPNSSVVLHGMYSSNSYIRQCKS